MISSDEEYEDDYYDGMSPEEVALVKAVEEG